MIFQVYGVTLGCIFPIIWYFIYTDVGKEILSLFLSLLTKYIFLIFYLKTQNRPKALIVCTEEQLVRGHLANTAAVALQQ